MCKCNKKHIPNRTTRSVLNKTKLYNIVYKQMDIHWKNGKICSPACSFKNENNTDECMLFDARLKFADSDYYLLRCKKCIDIFG